jgi:predicted metal-dependent hydrolase
MKKFTAISGLVILLVVSGVALVYSASPANIPDRIASQQQRIDEGVASGKLTRGESDVLQDNLNWIRSTFARMKADGRLNPGEISKLEAMLERNSQMIANKKQNPITRVYQADIPERIANQQWRIDEGIASGKLTRGEADVLQDNLNWIRSTFARMKADRRLNQGEISKLEAMLDQNSQMISNKKNNPIKRVYQADVPERIADQQWRIDQGVASRELTRAEADVLQDNLNWIKATFVKMKADGRLKQKEISRLDSMLDRNSQMIFNKKHNPIKKVY